MYKSDEDQLKLIKDLKKIIIGITGKFVKILVFDSSTESKWSYHIVVDGVYLKTHKELEVFYQRVVSKLDEPFRKVVDSSVYKSVQQFRIVGCQKFGKENKKKFDKELSYRFTFPTTYRTEIAKFNYMLSTSLIGNLVDSHEIHGFSPKTEERELSTGSAQEGDVEAVLKIFYAKYSPDDFRFSDCKEKNGNLILVLRRLNPTYCESCQRIHESENPFITVTGTFRTIRFYCRRKEEGLSDNIGELGIPQFQHLDFSDPPDLSKLEEIPERKDSESPEIVVDLEETVLEDISDTNLPKTPTRTKNSYRNLRRLNLRGGLVY